MTIPRPMSLFLFAVVVICNGIFVFFCVLMVPVCAGADLGSSAIPFMGWMALLAVAGIALTAGLLAPDEQPVLIRTAYVAAVLLIITACWDWYLHSNIFGRPFPPIESIVQATLAIANVMTLAFNRPLRQRSMANG